jgi:N-acetyl-1-D-myo-inositol-2-amino-2-deoxy-alpha-D-glucopyranoside deacetylase
MTMGENGPGTEPERVLFVHAHPDDETIATGGTIAALVERGAAVTVLTCTRGERGEVIPSELQYLLDSEDELAAFRTRELSAAMAILGVTDHRFLGAENARWVGRDARRYLDSGMAWGESGAVALDTLHPESLAAADFGEVSSDIAAVVAEVGPDVIVSYNEIGGYGHPDHVRAVPFYAVEPSGSAATTTLEVDVAGVLDRKRDALRAHRTQVAVDGDSFALSNGVSHPIDTVERFRRVHREYPPGRQPFAAQTRGVKVFSAVVGLLIGVGVGAMLTVIHQTSATIAGVSVPIGVIAAIVVVALLLTGLRLVFGTRIVAGTTALGLLLTVGLLSLESSGGSVLVPASAAGYVWTVAPTIIALLVLGWPQLPAARRDKIVSPPEVKGSLPQ